MCSQVTKESMEFIAGEIMDAVQDSGGPGEGMSRIQEILESNGIIDFEKGLNQLKPLYLLGLSNFSLIITWSSPILMFGTMI